MGIISAKKLRSIQKHNQKASEVEKLTNLCRAHVCSNPTSKGVVINNFISKEDIDQLRELDYTVIDQSFDMGEPSTGKVIKVNIYSITW